jgi:DNA-binding CsgD family transcriptional regulator
LSRVRRLIQLLVGGRIPLVQCGQNSPKLGWHRASFTIKLGSALESKTRPDSDAPERAIELEFKNTDKEEQRLIAESDEAYLLDTVNKLPRNQIGSLKGWSKSKVTALLKRAYSRRGEEFVDGRGRKTQTKGWAAVFEKIGDEVVRRFAEGMDLKQIAVELGYSIDTIRNAFRHWHEFRGLPVPASQKKAKFLQDAQRAFKLDATQDMKRGEIAKAIGCTPSTLTRMLKKGYELNGKEFFDRRGHQLKADRMPKHQEIAVAVGPMIESGKSVTEVANELGFDRVTVNKAYSWYCDNHREAAYEGPQNTQ